MAKVEMYYSEWCGFCHRARALLQAKGVAWTGIDVDMTAGARQEMMARGGGRTVPQIFVDGAPIGGCEEIYALEAAGRLDALLGLAPAEGRGAGGPGAGKAGGDGD
jgi:glutaredoxin 3